MSTPHLHSAGESQKDSETLGGDKAELPTKIIWGRVIWPRRRSSCACHVDSDDDELPSESSPQPRNLRRHVDDVDDEDTFRPQDNVDNQDEEDDVRRNTGDLIPIEYWNFWH